MNEKIKESIELIRRAEKLSLSLNPQDGFYVAFSGGKDSQCVLELCKMAGVKYKAYYSVTGIDAPDSVRFIQEYYPEVEFVHPKQNYFKLVELKGLPMIQSRFCCERLKERIGAGNVLLDGVRAQESRSRAKYTEVMIRSRRRENVEKGRSRQLEEVVANEHRCIKGKDRVDMHPILNWTEEDVWRLIYDRKLKPNPMYSCVGRVGCMYCPFSKKNQLSLYEYMYPKYHKRLMLAIERFMSRKIIDGLNTPQEYYNWWKSKKTLKAWLASE